MDSTVVPGVLVLEATFPVAQTFHTRMLTRTKCSTCSLAPMILDLAGAVA